MNFHPISPSTAPLPRVRRNDLDVGSPTKPWRPWHGASASSPSGWSDGCTTSRSSKKPHWPHLAASPRWSAPAGDHLDVRRHQGRRVGRNLPCNKAGKPRGNLGRRRPRRRGGPSAQRGGLVSTPWTTGPSASRSPGHEGLGFSQPQRGASHLRVSTQRQTHIPSARRRSAVRLSIPR